MTTNPIPLETLRQALHEALRQSNGNPPVSDPLAGLHLFQEMQQPGDHPTRTLDRVIATALQALERRSPADATLLRRRFVDNEVAQQVAGSMHVSQTKFYEMQQLALTHLAETLQALENDARGTRRATVARRLPAPTYLSLVGITERLATLHDVVAREGTPWIISLEGMGGIGKTSLADALVRRLATETRFAAFGWVSAQRTFMDFGGAIQAVDHPALTVEALVDRLLVQLEGDDPLTVTLSSEQKLAALEERLKAQPHLIVIDNLETIEDVTALVPTLRRLMDPSKFLLTSRTSLYPQPHLHRLDVPPLSRPHALDLVRQTAEQAGLSELQSAQQETLDPIFDTVGGNPLALRLVVGQSYFHGLATVLEDLRAARGKRVEELYSYIYRHAWDQLGETTRQVFLAMPLASEEGADLAFLEEVSGIEAPALRPALEELVVLNLIDLGGGVQARRYSIHSLTRAFLQEQVLQWM